MSVKYFMAPFTVMVTVDDWPVLPAASVALTTQLCEPLLAVVVSQV